MKHIYAIILSILLGTVYYQIMENSIPTESNCSYMAAPVTDFLAFLWGVIVVYYGLDSDHVCDPETVETMKLINKDMRRESGQKKQTVKRKNLISKKNKINLIKP